MPFSSPKRGLRCPNQPARCHLASLGRVLPFMSSKESLPAVYPWDVDLPRNLVTGLEGNVHIGTLRNFGESTVSAPAAPGCRAVLDGPRSTYGQQIVSVCRRCRLDQDRRRCRFLFPRCSLQRKKSRTSFMVRLETTVKDVTNGVCTTSSGGHDGLKTSVENAD